MDFNRNIYTDYWVKVDLTEYDAPSHASKRTEYLDGGSSVPVTSNCRKGKAMYTVVSNFLVLNPWVYSGVDLAIIETQEPGNTPARVIASAIYGFLRSAMCCKGCDAVVFCGSSAKMNAKKFISQDLGVDFDSASCLGTAHSSKAYRTTKRSSYDLCKRWLCVHGTTKEKAVLEKYNGTKGDMKGDDLAEAYLLGFSDLMSTPTPVRNPLRRSAPSSSTDSSSSSSSEDGDKGGRKKRRSPVKTRSKSGRSSSLVGRKCKEEEEERDQSTKTTTTEPKEIPKKKRKTIDIKRKTISIADMIYGRVASSSSPFSLDKNPSSYSSPSSFSSRSPSSSKSLSSSSVSGQVVTIGSSIDSEDEEITGVLCDYLSGVKRKPK